MGVTNLYFLQDKYIVKNFYVALIGLKRFRIVTLPRVLLKMLFCKTNNILYSLENRIWDKTK